MRVDVVPGAALRGDLNAHDRELVGDGVGHGLAHGVGRRVIEVERAGQAVARIHAVRPARPAGGGEKRLGAVGVGFDLHIRARPRQAVADAVGHAAVAVEHVVDKRLAIDGEVDGLPDLEVAGHVVARGVGVRAVRSRGARGDHGKLDAARVDRVVGLERVAVHLLIRERGGGIGHIHLARANGGEGRVFLHKGHDHALDLRRLAVSTGVRLEDDLLATIPLRELIAPGADGVLAVVGAVRVLGNDAQHGQGIEKRVERFVQAKNDRVLVWALDRIDHREIGLGVLRGLDGCHGKGNVGGAHRLPVGEVRIVAQGKRPAQAVVRALVGRREVANELHVRVGTDKRGLDERLVDVFAAAPGHAGVEAGVRLARGAHGDGHLAGGVNAGRSRAISRRVLVGTGGEACRRARSQTPAHK